MPDPRSTLEDQLKKVQLRPYSVSEFHRRRERKHRNQRIRAGVLAVAIAAGGTGVAVRAFQAEPASTRTPTPGHQGQHQRPSPTGGTAVVAPPTVSKPSTAVTGEPSWTRIGAAASPPEVDDSPVTAVLGFETVGGATTAVPPVVDGRW